MNYINKYESESLKNPKDNKKEFKYINGWFSSSSFTYHEFGDKICFFWPTNATNPIKSKDVDKAEIDLSDLFKEEKKEPTKCTCKIQDLMYRGCKCGFIEVERKRSDT